MGEGFGLYGSAYVLPWSIWGQDYPLELRWNPNSDQLYFMLTTTVPESNLVAWGDLDFHCKLACISSSFDVIVRFYASEGSFRYPITLRITESQIRLRPGPTLPTVFVTRVPSAPVSEWWDLHAWTDADTIFFEVLSGQEQIGIVSSPMEVPANELPPIRQIQLQPGNRESAPGPIYLDDITISPIMEMMLYSSTQGDINGDGVVDLNDLSMLLSAYATCLGDQGYIPVADLNGNNCIELGDLAILLGNYDL
jgi:hypothetical protein